MSNLKPFSSFEELDLFIKNKEKTEFVQFWIHRSRTIRGAIKKGIKRKPNEKIKYYEVTYKCIHSGGWKSRSSGKRPEQRYGLLLPKKSSNQDMIQRPACFDEGSDSGESGAGDGDWKKRSLMREATKSVEKRQTKVLMQKALNQDASIYQYDEIYDEMKDKGIKPESKPQEKKQSRYIQSLKRHAEKRKLENERRLERQVQKERQAEGEEFKDKETFVTSSYKKKLEEFQKMDEEEKRMDRLEEIGDVSKQKDMSGFYRHLYKVTVDADSSLKKEDNSKDAECKVESSVNKSPNTEVSKEVTDTNEQVKKPKRQYRKRAHSRSSREEGEKTTSSSSSSSSSSESEDEKKSKLKRPVKDENMRITEKIPEVKKRSRSKEKPNKESIISSLENSEDINKVENKSDIKKGKEEKIKDKIIKEETKNQNANDKKVTTEKLKVSVNIWVKRTVGTTFDDALRRYLERKSKRQGFF